jgi:hypothetical protein
MEVLHEKVKLLGENEQLSIPREAMLFLPVVQEVTKIDVKELSSVLLDQVIARMPISDT